MSKSPDVSLEHRERLAQLEHLLVDNPDLEDLETRLGGFNIFEAIGAVRHERRHSAFLAFLLDPSAKHGLGDDFVRRFLQNALMSPGNQALPISPIELDVWDLNEI